MTGVTFLQLALQAQEDPDAVAAAIVEAVNARRDTSEAVAPLATMSREGRLRVFRLLQEAMPERAGRATVSRAGGAARAQ